MAEGKAGRSTRNAMAALGSGKYAGGKSSTTGWKLVIQDVCPYRHAAMPCCPTAKKVRSHGF